MSRPYFASGRSPQPGEGSSQNTPHTHPTMVGASIPMRTTVHGFHPTTNTVSQPMSIPTANGASVHAVKIGSLGFRSSPLAQNHGLSSSHHFSPASSTASNSTDSSTSAHLSPPIAATAASANSPQHQSQTGTSSGATTTSAGAMLISPPVQHPTGNDGRTFSYSMPMTVPSFRRAISFVGMNEGFELLSSEVDSIGKPQQAKPTVQPRIQNFSALGQQLRHHLQGTPPAVAAPAPPPTMQKSASNVHMSDLDSALDLPELSSPPPNGPLQFAFDAPDVVDELTHPQAPARLDFDNVHISKDQVLGAIPHHVQRHTPPTSNGFLHPGAGGHHNSTLSTGNPNGYTNGNSHHSSSSSAPPRWTPLSSSAPSQLPSFGGPPGQPSSFIMGGPLAFAPSRPRRDSGGSSVASASTAGNNNATAVGGSGRSPSGSISLGASGRSPSGSISSSFALVGNGATGNGRSPGGSARTSIAFTAQRRAEDVYTPTTVASEGDQEGRDSRMGGSIHPALSQGGEQESAGGASGWISEPDDDDNMSDGTLDEQAGITRDVHEDGSACSLTSCTSCSGESDDFSANLEDDFDVSLTFQSHSGSLEDIIRKRLNQTKREHHIQRHLHHRRARARLHLRQAREEARLRGESFDASTSLASALHPSETVSVGSYTHGERQAKIQRYLEKRRRRVWSKKILYSCRKNFADKRPRVGGRFVKLRNDDPPPPSTVQMDHSASLQGGGGGQMMHHHPHQDPSMLQHQSYSLSTSPAGLHSVGVIHGHIHGLSRGANGLVNMTGFSLPTSHYVHTPFDFSPSALPPFNGVSMQADSHSPQQSLQAPTTSSSSFAGAPSTLQFDKMDFTSQPASSSYQAGLAAALGGHTMSLQQSLQHEESPPAHQGSA